MLKQKALVGGILAASMLVMTGCVGGTGGAPSADSSITLASATGIPQLNPVIRTFAWEEVLFPLLWNGLTKTTPSGEIAEDLATGWEVTDDQKTWTFTLRDDVTFSNGKPFTADDVVATMEYYLDPDTATQESNKIQAIEEVVAIDKYTVEMNLSEPVATLPAGLVWVKMVDMESLDTIDVEPIGTGPFVVESFVPDSTIELVRNPDYFGEAAGVDRITIEKAPESTSAVTSLRSGDIGVLWSVPPGDVEQFETDSSITLVRPEVPSQYSFWEMDTTSAPFNDVRVRQALAYAVDRDAILEAAYYGQGIVAPTNNALGVDNPWYAEGLTDYSYDLDKAAELFEEAGVTELTWWGIAGQYPEFQTAAEILQASLAEIGVTLTISNMDVGTWVDKFYPAGKSYPGLIIPNLSSTPQEPAYALNFYLKGRCECNWDDPAFEESYVTAIGTGDATERKAAWGVSQQIINDQVPIIVPLQSTVVTATQANIKGVWVEGGGQPHLESATVSE